MDLRILFSRIFYLLFGFIREFFGFFDKKYWLFWHFLYILILKQKSVLRRSKQAANLLKKIRDWCQQDSLKPSVEQIIGYGYDHPQKNDGCANKYLIKYKKY